MRWKKERMKEAKHKGKDEEREERRANKKETINFE